VRRIYLSRLFPFPGLGARTLRGRAAPLVARARALALRKLGGREHVLEVHAGDETGKERERSLGPTSARTPAPSAHRARARSWRRCGGRRSGAADLRMAMRCIANASSMRFSSLRMGRPTVAEQHTSCNARCSACCRSTTLSRSTFVGFGCLARSCRCGATAGEPARRTPERNTAHGGQGGGSRVTILPENSRAESSRTGGSRAGGAPSGAARAC
jgi:hypothetical protein